ncbi:unnamed protein product [Echinostoma caproni]|uniref:Uncharacterized protein n=1 Tax=Echinostoma caproni TaxID=27848 RepID=A0A3P8H346_9TREM|nr:unnamed protein product [Echinostoma caproni]
MIASSPETSLSPLDKPDSPQSTDFGRDVLNPERPMSCSTSGTTPARTSPLHVDYLDEDQDKTSSNHLVEKVHSADVTTVSSRNAKRRRLSTERNDVSPNSSHFSEASDLRQLDEGLSAFRICVLCGEPQTVDTWDGHQLTHRNPHMDWNGLELSNPNRIVLARRQTKVYRLNGQTTDNPVVCFAFAFDSHGQENWDKISSPGDRIESFPSNKESGSNYS